MTIEGLFKLLHERQGSYAGEGINHEQEPFNGRLRLDSVAQGAGFLLRFEARSLDGEVCFHTEHSLIARDDTGALVLWHLGSNLKFLTPHRLSAVEPEHSYVFGYGDPAGEGFAEEITLTLDEDRIGYGFAWGLPRRTLRAEILCDHGSDGLKACQVRADGGAVTGSCGGGPRGEPPA